MDKQLKDYIKYYIGQPVRVCINIEGNVVIETLTGKMISEDEDLFESSNERGAKLILRKLESIGKEESEAMEIFRSELRNNDLTAAFRLTHYLLSRGFDLFQLIENNLAVDKATIK